MPDQLVVRRPPGCCLRLEVGSDEAPWRQPTCHFVQVLSGLARPERGPHEAEASWGFFFFLCLNKL